MQKLFNELVKKLASLLTIKGLVPTYDYRYLVYFNWNDKQAFLNIIWQSSF